MASSESIAVGRRSSEIVGAPDSRGEDESVFELVVSRAEQVAEGSVALTLTSPSGAQLPQWEPGAHIDLILNEALVRQYSLCGDPADRRAWRLGVLREPDGRGGSEFVHRHVKTGSRVLVRGPRNHFALEPARRYDFIAGGIGITPILAMIKVVSAMGAEWRLLYGGRSMASMAFVDELEGYGDCVRVCPQDRHGLLDLAGFLGSSPPETAVYCCGPEPLIAAVERICATLPTTSLHVERFAPRATATTANEAFEVECAATGITLTVSPDSTILETVRAAGIDVFSSCAEGTCGSCETDVLKGTPDHRDSVLTPEERKANESMMICVSRCLGGRLVLDL